MTGFSERDCFSAYGPQIAAAKQKCLAHLERDLDALLTSRFAANIDFAQKIKQVLWTARKAHQDYHTGLLTTSELQQKRPNVETELQAILDRPPASGWPADAQRLANRLERHWNEWFTFLTHPDVKPDNNDAERALRPVVVHRKVSGGARSDWGAKLVAQMFSFLETMRLQGASPVASLCELLSLAGRGPPGLQST